MSAKKYVGTSVPDVNAVNKVTGASIYAPDLYFPGMLYGVMIRSTHPHARIKRINVGKSRKVDGVVAVVTYRDFPGLGFGTYVYDQTIFTDHPRFVGDPIGAVAAESLASAQKALELVEIEYEILPHLLDPEEAMKPDAILLHPNMHNYEECGFPGFFNYLKDTNCPNQFRLRKGDVEEGFRQADYVIESRISLPQIYHGQLETHGCVCQFTPDGNLIVNTSTQGAFLAREMLSHALGIPMNKVEVNQTTIGAGFGGKISVNLEPRCAALSSKCSYRPVKMVLSREEDWQTVFTRSGLTGYYKTGVNKDGKIIARKVNLYWDSGAYADYEVSVARSAGYMSAGPYDIPNIWINSHAVYTNKLIATAYRGFGCSETTFCYEQDMDIIADELGFDPIKFRLQNAHQTGSINATGQRIKSCALPDCITWVTDKAKELKLKKSSDGPIKRGYGIACMHKFTVHTVPTTDILKLNEDGTFILETSAQDLGQGSSTVMCQIAAEVLGVTMDKITVVPVRTNYTGYGWQTAASSKTFFNGNSTIMAATQVREKLLEYASVKLNLPISDLDTKDGTVFCKSDPKISLPFSSLSMGVFNDEGGQLGGPIVGYGVFTIPDGSGLDKETGQGRRPSAFWMYAAMIAEVEVDTETGKVKVLKLITANDVGKAINPRKVRGQIIAGAIQGLGSAIFEEVIFDDQGRVLNANMHDYKMPTICDIPDDIFVDIVETSPHPDGPFGAKGVGEPSMACPAAAIANAVANALGVRIRTMPITPDRVLAVIKKEGK